MNPPDRSMARLSIGYYCPTWPLGASPNGISTYVSNLTKQLKLLGHHTTVLADTVAKGYHNPQVYDLESVRTLIGRRPMNRVRYGLWRRLASHSANSHLYRQAMVTTFSRAIADQRISIFEIEESFGWARWLSKASLVPICVRLHGPWFEVGPALGLPENASFRARVEQERRAILSADAVTAPSCHILEKTRTFYGLNLENAEVIPNPAEPAAHHWQLSQADHKRILFVGRFDRLKGGDLVVDAFARILKEEPEARLSFVGPDRGCRTDNGDTWQIEQYIRHRLPGALETKRVEWLGAQPFSALAQLRRQALVCVICSRYETFPYTVIEAMALGCPIVAATVGGIPEIIRNESNGLLHQQSDPEDLACKVVSLLKNPTWAAHLGQKAADDCCRYYHPEVVAAHTVHFYESVLRRASQGGRKGIGCFPRSR